MTLRGFILAGALIPLLLAGASPASADSEADQLREQLRATVLQLRQLQDQQAAAPVAAPAAPAADAASAAKLKSALAQLRAARRKAAEAAALQTSLDQERASNAALTAAAATSATQIEALKTAFGQASDAGRVAATERDQLKAQLAAMTRVATACQAKNTRLIAFSESLLKAYGRLGVGQVLASREPFLGLERVKLENIAQDREDTVRADRCDPRLDGAAMKTSGG